MAGQRWKLDGGLEDETKGHRGFLSECVILPTHVKALWRFPLGNGVQNNANETGLTVP